MDSVTDPKPAVLLLIKKLNTTGSNSRTKMGPENQNQTWTWTQLTWRRSATGHRGRSSSSRRVLSRRPGDAGSCCSGSDRPSALWGHHLTQTEIVRTKHTPKHT